MLGQFHARVESIIFRHQGTLDKFLGDGVMASFGTPLTQQDDSGRALRCVAELVQVELPDGLSISVGAHRGNVVLGDVGSERRLEFATIGDTVNVAARLEGATRKAGVRALVSDALMQDAEYAGEFKRSGPLKLRGRKEDMVVWELR